MGYLGSITDRRDVFRAGDGGYASLRIPAIARTASGALLAFAEGRRDGADDWGDIDIVVRTSQDGGASWGPLRVAVDGAGDTAGNPVPFVLPDSGRVVLLYVRAGAEATEHRILDGSVADGEARRVWVRHSDDEGETWSEPSELTADTKRPQWRWYATGPGHGTVLRGGPHAGRLVAPANHSLPGDDPEAPTRYAAHLLLSDDGGGSWRIGAVQEDPEGDGLSGNETALAELPGEPGALYVNTRNQRRRPEASRGVAFSRDGGEGFEGGGFRPAPAQAAPVCQGTVLAVADGSRLVLSAPGERDSRRGLTLRLLAPDGFAEEESLRLSDEPAAYSDLVEVAEEHGGGLGVLMETGIEKPYEVIRFVRVTLGG